MALKNKMLNVTIGEHPLIWRFESSWMWHCVFWWLVPTFWRIMVPLFQQSSSLKDLLDCLTLDGEGTMILQNVGHHSPNATVSDSRRLISSATPVSEAQTSHCSIHLPNLTLADSLHLLHF